MMTYYNELIEKADDEGMPDDVLENSKAFSDTIFNAVMAWSKKDNYAQTRSASKYTVNDTDGRWVPTPPMYASAMESHWREITHPGARFGAGMQTNPATEVFDQRHYYRLL